MASGSRPISQALSEDPYSNHQLLPVLFRDQYHAAWEEFCIAVKANSPNKTLYCSKEVYDEWYIFWERFPSPLLLLLKETPQPPKQKEPKGKLKAPVMTDIDTQKLFRQAVASPSEYDGTKKEFATWWLNMQLYLLGYASISDKGKIIAVLSRLTKGDAAFWAQAKKEDVIKGNLRKFDEFKAQLEQWFSNPIWPQQALNKSICSLRGRCLLKPSLTSLKYWKESAD